MKYLILYKNLLQYFMKLITIILIVLCFPISLYCQEQPIDVTDQTIKIGTNSEESLYYGFAEGDQIIFNFKEINGKDLKEIEIIEYPTNSKFSDFKATSIENKIIHVVKKGVYEFRFYNGNLLSGRICKIQIQRIPANANNKNFNTNVSWIIKQDTTWNTYTKDILVSYDTSYVQKTKKELANSSQKEELIIDKTQRVHSQSNENGNKTFLFFSLPSNKINEYQSTKVISWAYWVGVGEEANQAWKQNVQIVGGMVKGAASYYSSPLGALAVGAIVDLMTPKMGEDVYYAISDNSGKDNFMAGNEYRLWDSGKGVAGYKKFTASNLCQGTYFVLLSNDNYIQGIDVSVKVVAIIETNTYIDKQYTEQIIRPKYEKKIFRDPVITKTKIPIICN